MALLSVPLMLSAAYAERGADLPLPSLGLTAAAPVVAPPPLPSPPAVYTDPLQRSVWVNGVKAVHQMLVTNGGAGFSRSYINVAAGDVVSFCGEVAGTSGYYGESGAQRFISIFGQSQSTMLEGNDASFEVLWTRVCARTESPS